MTKTKKLYKRILRLSFSRYRRINVRLLHEKIREGSPLFPPAVSICQINVSIHRRRWLAIKNNPRYWIKIIFFTPSLYRLCRLSFEIFITITIKALRAKSKFSRRRRIVVHSFNKKGSFCFRADTIFQGKLLISFYCHWFFVLWSAQM